ncbi:hypothetical protein ACHAWC_008751 [Mediolabrus comicus]
MKMMTGRKLGSVAALVLVGILCQIFFFKRLLQGYANDEPTQQTQIYYKKSPPSGNGVIPDDSLQQPITNNELFDPLERPMAARDIFTMTPLEVCGRMGAISPQKEQQIINYFTNQCPLRHKQIAFDDPIFLIEGQDPYGRTGNKLLGFLHALEKARKTGRVVAIVIDSWALPVLTNFFFAIKERDFEGWQEQMEKIFCIKLLTSEEVPKYTDVVRKDAKDIFMYTGESDDGIEGYIEFQTYHIRNLLRHYNDGEGLNSQKKPVRNMCISLDEIFGHDTRTQVYSVIHSRSFNSRPLERKAGMDQLKRIALKSGCDPVAALEMSPEYVKAILKPIGMLQHPIVLITDGQDLSVAERLLNDPEISPNLRLVPNRAKWVGSDITLAIMSNVFIGNPASTFSGFIAKSRLALGFDNTFMFRAQNEKGQWVNVCDDRCIFSKRIMKSMA